MSNRKLELLSENDEEYDSDDSNYEEELSPEEYKQLVNTRINDAMYEYATQLNEYCKNSSLLLCETLKHEDLCNFLLELLN